MKLLRILKPVFWMNCTQTGLLVDGVEFVFRLVAQYVRLNDLGLEFLLIQKLSRLLYRSGCVVNTGYVKTTLGKFCSFPACTAASPGNAAGLQRAAAQPFQELR